MISKVLIANRGEIAVRVIRACQELGIATVALYTEADREGSHVQLADQAFGLGHGSYLDQEAIFGLAERAGADAIHPGYGLLAENAEFAAGCVERGLTWIGPNPHAIALMGSKTVARRMAEEAKVPVVPGLTGSFEDPAPAIDFASRHGYPCVVKAAAGGGGRGIQVVNGPAEFPAAISRGQREGLTYFGSAEIFVERYLDRPRHIEIQVLCDRHGHAIALGERECSIQRRHQKLLEEAPSVALSPTLRREMSEAALRMARAVGYDSAGTCEFLFQDGAFYFLEMNTRIQVEHTITEIVYDVDLVKEQLRIAGGEPISEVLWRGDLSPRGWAIECRINAEDPAANFRPAPGLITHYRTPGGPGVRIDDAVHAGYRIPDQYDSLIAKLVTWGHDRSEAIARMRRALKEMVVEGVPTTIPLHLAILSHPDFLSGEFSTHFIGQAFTTEDLKALGGAPAALSNSPVGDEPTVRSPQRTFEVVVNQELFAVNVSEVGGNAAITGIKPKRAVSRGSQAGSAATGAIIAPMHSTVSRVLVELGERVEAGQVILLLEAMKMETEIATAVAGTVVELQIKPGQTVEGGQVLGMVKDA